MAGERRIPNNMTNEITFQEVAKSWMEEKRLLVKRSTFCNYQLIVRTHLLPAFANFTTIGENEAQRFALEKISSGLSRKFAHDIVAVLISIMKHGAKRYGKAAPNWKIKYPTTTERKPLPVLSLSSHRKLLQYLAEKPSPKTIGIMIALCTGMRIGEVCGLEWENVNLTKRVITVGQTAGRIYDIEKRATERIISTPKTKCSNREIPIGAALYKALRAVSKEAAGKYVVGGRDEATDPRTYREFFSRLLNRLGIQRIVFHGLRHTFATRCIESHCDYKTVSAILGHSNIATTLNLYVHPDLEQKKKCIERLGKVLDAL